MEVIRRIHCLAYSVALLAFWACFKGCVGSLFGSESISLFFVLVASAGLVARVARFVFYAKNSS